MARQKFLQIDARSKDGLDVDITFRVSARYKRLLSKYYTDETHEYIDNYRLSNDTMVDVVLNQKIINIVYFNQRIQHILVSKNLLCDKPYTIKGSFRDYERLTDNLDEALKVVANIFSKQGIKYTISTYINASK